MLRAGIESACPIRRGHNQFAPCQVNLGELDRRVAVVEAWYRLDIAFSAQKSAWNLLCSFSCLLNSARNEYSCRPLIEYHCLRRSSTNDIYHNIDVIRACFVYDD